jgi:zinc transport system substrate-binding protein
MRKVMFLSLIVSIGSIFFGCGNINTQENIIENKDSKVSVASTIYPIYAIVNEIGGEYIDSQLVLPVGSSPHTYEITPKVLKKLEKTEIVFSVGHGVDNWSNKIFEVFSDLEIYIVDKDIEFITNEEGNIDPHYWLSVEHAKQIAKNISEELSAKDSEHADIYISNLQDFIERLEKREKSWRTALDTVENKNIIVFHDAWNYFAEYFDINIVASFEPFPGKSPTPKVVAALQQTIKEYNVKIIFIEPQLSKTAIEAIANDFGIEIKILDPLGGVEGREYYIDFIEYNVLEIVGNS